MLSTALLLFTSALIGLALLLLGLLANALRTRLFLGDARLLLLVVIAIASLIVEGLLHGAGLALCLATRLLLLESLLLLRRQARTLVLLLLPEMDQLLLAEALVVVALQLEQLPTTSTHKHKHAA